MVQFNFLCILCIFTIISEYECLISQQPEQIHISLGKTPKEMIVTWVTMDAIDEPFVEYGSKTFERRVKGQSTKFIDGGSEKRQMYIHRVTMDNLIPGQEYVYHVGSSYGWSAIYWFKAIKEGSDWSPRFAIYGDMGNVNAQSIPRLQQEIQRGMYDAVLHVGDFAYDMNSDNARVGDEFMRQIEPIAAYLPYMTTVGNHEQAYNFSNYINRFTMIDVNSGINNSLFYSYNIGPVHFISFSTEFYFYLEYGWHQIATQYKWLEKDLQEANKPENRKKRPWIITLGHRPMYCNTNGLDDCNFRDSVIRKGIPIIHTYGLEDLFYKYGVDIEIWAHEHLYERLYPIYDLRVYNGSKEHPYTNPKAPVHIITGSAGCVEKLDNFVKNPKEWSAFRISDYGYTRMYVQNKTHIYMEQVSDDMKGQIVDKVLIVKERHGSYN